MTSAPETPPATAEEPPADIWSDVGRLSGDVLGLLEREGPMSAFRLRSSLKISQSLLFLALGWLCREGKVRLERGDAGYRVERIG